MQQTFVRYDARDMAEPMVALVTTEDASHLDVRLGDMVMTLFAPELLGALIAFAQVQTIHIVDPQQDPSLTERRASAHCAGVGVARAGPRVGGGRSSNAACVLMASLRPTDHMRSAGLGGRQPGQGRPCPGKLV